MITTTALMNDLAAATDLTSAATIKEGAIAAHLLALTARQQCPTATTVLLKASNQGNWLVAVGISDPHPSDPSRSACRNLAVVAAFNDDNDAASHMYWPSLEYVPGLTFTRNHGNITNITLDIQAVLNQMNGLPPTPPEGPDTEPAPAAQIRCLSSVS
ncbi:MAG: hypothetical protein ACOH1Y_12555 [Propionicimonas sp.]